MPLCAGAPAGGAPYLGFLFGLRPVVWVPRLVSVPASAPAPAGEELAEEPEPPEPQPPPASAQAAAAASSAGLVPLERMADADDRTRAGGARQRHARPSRAGRSGATVRAMIEPLEGMAPGTIGFRATGTVTREEYRATCSRRRCARRPRRAR